MSFLSRLSVGSAFVASASRMVGASYRVMDAYDPALRQQGVTPAPEVVIQREGISLALAWTFGLFTSALAEGMQKKFRVPVKVSLFINVVVANILAEGVSRLIAYRKTPAAGDRKRVPGAATSVYPMMPRLKAQLNRVPVALNAYTPKK